MQCKITNKADYYINTNHKIFINTTKTKFMRTIYLSIGLLATSMAFSQEKPKTENSKDKEIQEVTLTKKVFQKKADRMVYDVASSPISKGNNAFDLLKETPLVSSTDDKSLKIVGKNDAIIYINGRKSNMNPDAIVEMMKSMPAENIQRIEVITVPSSEFAVEGNQGIINIVLKKRPSDGMNGNLKMENNQSYFNSQSTSGSLNYRKGKLGINTSLYFNNRQRRQKLMLSNGNSLFSQTSEGFIDEPGKSFGGNINFDYHLTDKQNIGLSYDNSFYRTDALGTNLYNVLTDLAKQEKTITRTQNLGKSNSDNHSFTLNYELKTDDKGSKLNVSSSYLNYLKSENIHSSTNLLDNQGNILKELKKFNQQIPLKVDNYGVLVDNILKLKKDYTLSFGASFNHTKTDSDTQYINVNPPTGLDANQSNHFVYTEKIPSAYVTLEKNFGEKWSTKAGLRFENTTSEGVVLNKDITINRKFNYFLPYVSVSYNPNQKHSFSYSFSSRVERPQFWAITPTKLYLTTTNYVQNNPFAKPEKYYNQELMYMFKSAYFLNVSHSYITDAVEQIPLQGVNQKGENVLAYIRNNYGTKQEMSASIGMQKQFFKGIWNANNSFYVGHWIVNGEVTGDPTDTKNEVIFNKNVLNYNSTFYGVQLNNTIRLSSKKDLFLGVNYMYNSGFQLELGKLSPFQSLDLSMKKIWKDFTFNAQVRDVFHTSENKIVGYQNNGAYNIVDQIQYKQRFILTVTYSFGNKKVEKVRNIEGANQSIKTRTGGN